MVGPPDSAVHLGEPVNQPFAAKMLPLRPIAGSGPFHPVCEASCQDWVKLTQVLRRCGTGSWFTNRPQEKLEQRSFSLPGCRRYTAHRHGPLGKGKAEYRPRKVGRGLGWSAWGFPGYGHRGPFKAREPVLSTFHGALSPGVHERFRRWKQRRPGIPRAAGSNNRE